MTAKFREFYVPAGAGSNFLASKCLWAGKFNASNCIPQDFNRNEFFVYREKVNNRWNNISESELEGIPLICDDKDLISHTKRMSPILIELNKIITIKTEKDSNSRNRDTIIENGDIWKRAEPVEYMLFKDQIHPSMYSTGKIPESVIEMISQAEDYFVKCREYYFKVCEQNDWNSFSISHTHPFISISSQLKLPENFKSLAMTLDSDTYMFIAALWGIKGEDFYRKFNVLEDAHFSNREIERIFGPDIKLCDDTVSYRKIFFENDSDEIRKTYEFFDNEDYFDENKTNILQEFQKYHNDNMAVLKQYAPDVFEEIFKRKAR